MTHRRIGALIAPLLALLAFAAPASAWHVTADCQIQYHDQGASIIASAQWYGFSYGQDRSHLEIFRVNRNTDQWRKVAWRDGGLPTSLSYPVPLNDEFTGQLATTHRTYVAKAWFDVAEGGASKSQDCVVPPPVKNCLGEYQHPNAPFPVCPPPPPVPPPVPPQPPVPPAPPAPPVPPTPPTPPKPPYVCKPGWKVTVSRGATHYRFRLRDENGLLRLAKWRVDGRYVRTTRVLTVRKGKAKHVVVGTSKRRGCRGQAIMPRRVTPPRTVG